MQQTNGTVHRLSRLTSYPTSEFLAISLSSPAREKFPRVPSHLIPSETETETLTGIYLSSKPYNVLCL